MAMDDDDTIVDLSTLLAWLHVSDRPKNLGIVLAQPPHLEWLDWLAGKSYRATIDDRLLGR